MVHGQRGARLALAGLGLAALSAAAAAPPFAAEARRPSSTEADRIEQSAGVEVQADESGLASHGGALYSPFSTAFDMAASTPHAYATSTRQNADDGSPNPVTAAVTALVAVGFLVILVRVLIAS
ncbi:hypothetical protein LJR290_005080 [Variovorax sp. LjRoot290]|uniref:hypothetical protein n=1 Tax=Variovorax sp. LjRoot290 TaxID=3342316 RepID=UPI003ECF2DD6